MKELSIELTIDENGFLEAETFGFKGKICESELKELLKNDFVVAEFERKDDYYKSEDEAVAKKLESARQNK